MSMFGENHKKNELYEEIDRFFINGGSIEEMLDVLHIAMQYGTTPIDLLNSRIRELQQKIDKAIEYINDRYDGEVLTHTFDKTNVKELSDILKGGKDE